MPNQKTLPNRKSIRLPGYDYSQAGYYFVTIVVQDRRCLFGQIEDSIKLVGAQRAAPANPAKKMVLSRIGKIVESVWLSLPEHHNIELTSFQIMPNHVHFIISLNGGIAGGARTAPTAGALSTVIRSFKSECTKQIRRFANNPDFNVWQRNYYETIILKEQVLYDLQYYIETNPENWSTDEENPYKKPVGAGLVPARNKKP